jgi:hypothetical protein
LEVGDVLAHLKRDDQVLAGVLEGQRGEIFVPYPLRVDFSTLRAVAQILAADRVREAAKEPLVYACNLFSYVDLSNGRRTNFFPEQVDACAKAA